MNKNIRNYKDLKKTIETLHAQVNSYEKSWYTNPLKIFLGDKYIGGGAACAKEKSSPILQFLKDQLLTPTILFSGAKFLYRIAVKRPKLLFRIGGAFVFVCVKMKKWWNEDRLSIDHGELSKNPER